MTADNSSITLALMENYSRYAEGLDSKNWPMVRACFDDQVCIDYGSISDPTGSPDVAREADDWLAILQGVINGFDITRHCISNFRVEITEISVSCKAYLSADHVIFADPELPLVGAEEVITVVGEYHNHYRLVGEQWKISRSQLRVDYSRGNLGLFEKSAERVAAQLASPG